MSRKSFSKAFKAEAVKLLEQSGRPAADVARELGIRRNQLYKWQEQMKAKGGGVFPGSGRQSRQSEEVKRLRKELEQVKEERDILKKAAAYFAKELG
jgi:transposase